MITGAVKFFNSARGFGFTSPDGGSEDAFVHISAVENAGMSTLAEGQKLTYDHAGLPSPAGSNCE